MSSNKSGSHGGQPTDFTGGMPYLPEDKFGLSRLEALERYGEEGTPIPADEAYVAPITNFSKKDVRAEKWILVNWKANSGQGSMTFANTFDGTLGSNFKQSVATFPLDPKKLREKLKTHARVDIDACPVACTPEEAKKHHMETELQSTSLVGEATAEEAKAK